MCLTREGKREQQLLPYIERLPYSVFSIILISKDTSRKITSHATDQTNDIMGISCSLLFTLFSECDVALTDLRLSYPT